MNSQFRKKTAIIIGAGPAGLTAAYELLKRTDIVPVILEKSGDIGGISKTINYKGNRMDIGGHRFFSKSDRVMTWWFNIMPVQTNIEGGVTVSYQNKSREVEASSTPIADPDKVMLIRNRLSRIYFLRKFFTYPIQLSIDTLGKLGPFRTIAIMFSYLAAQLFPRKPENNLEDFMINRFGKVLYKLFFKDYTEKVWGIPCHKISAEWGAQRIKGVSISKALQHAIQSATKKKKGSSDIAQKDTETSLIEQFLYPKFGPGQLWEEVARQVEEMGGKILMQHDVKRIYTSDNENRISAIAAINRITGETSYLEGDYFFSTMPVQELIGGIDGSIPEDVKNVASGLQYRDFITVGILLKKLSYQDKSTGEWKPLELKDTWIYIQEKDVTVGRLQVFNNWSPYMVKDPQNTWIGMEFFCNQHEAFWNKPDEEIKQIAILELEKIGLASPANVLDSTIIRVEKTYPAYFGTYKRFHVIRDYIDRFPNLFLVGRNGMHKYNNSDHSMLTAMTAVDNIVAGVISKENIWAINTEEQYHEEKTPESDVNKQKEMVLPGSTRLGQPHLSLKDFILKNRAYKSLLIFSAVIAFIELAIFKYFYPYPSFINGDSYVYLQTAYWNQDINTYPIGYSRFLRLLSVFTHSDIVLVTCQYLLLQMSGILLVFTIYYFYNPGRLVKMLLFATILLNPIFLYLSNSVSSDALFLSLSLSWFTLLIWLVHRPSARLLIFHGLLLFLAFTVRYNALYYPVIAIVALILSPQRIAAKITGFLFSILLVGLFIQYTSHKYEELSGKRQFSPFSGWQMANNAMYGYKYVDKQDVKKVPARFRQLDKMIRNYFDTTRDISKHPEEQLKASTVYMWTPNAPLQKFMQNKFRNDSIKDPVVDPIKRWATVAPLYAEYGAYIIREYPVQFVQYYLWPNIIKYYAPPVEFLETYNTGIDSVHAIAQYWFGFKTNKVKTQTKDFKVNILDIYPILTGIMNVVFLLGSFSFIFLQGYKQQPQLWKGLILVGMFWLVNFGFSVFASPIALRFQMFPIIVFITFSYLLMEFLWKAAKSSQ